jgi:hypothetical protein
MPKPSPATTPAESTAAAPSLNDLLKGHDRLRIRRLTQKVYEMNKAKAELEESLSAAKAELMAELSLSGATRFMDDGLLVTMYDSTRESLSRQRLIEQGVSVAAIDAATTRSTFPILRITRTEGVAYW